MISEKQFNAIKYINGLKITEDKKMFLENFINSDEVETLTLEQIKTEINNRAFNPA